MKNLLSGDSFEVPVRSREFLLHMQLQCYENYNKFSYKRAVLLPIRTPVVNIYST